MTARGSHRPSLRTLVKKALREALGEKGPRTIVVATSGGPDSQALLHVLAGLQDELGLGLRAHGVDHGLRPEASQELDLAAALARELGVPFASTRVAVAPGANLQARAREARWAALRTAAMGAMIATGHHQDDRAETVLMRLLRGTSLGSLAVLPPRDGDRLRPMIGARRADVERHLARNRVAFARDPSNEDTRYLRVRVRREVLPLLESLNPRIVEHLSGLADEAVAFAAEAPLDLPKPTRNALAKLVDLAGREPAKARKARILLPGGLVLALLPPHAEGTKSRLAPTPHDEER